MVKTKIKNRNHIVCLDIKPNLSFWISIEKKKGISQISITNPAALIGINKSDLHKCSVGNLEVSFRNARAQ